MKGTLAIAALVALGMATPAFADRFYVVRDSDGSDCSIVRQLPKGDEKVVVGEKAAYPSRRQAEQAAHDNDSCRSVPIRRQLPSVALH